MMACDLAGGCSMNEVEYWKNFNLGDELQIAGVFIYNGLRRFNRMRALNHLDEIFEVLYDLSVGLERILKIAVVFVEHDGDRDQHEFELSLHSHNHNALLARLKKKENIGLGDQHAGLLGLLDTFYSDFRYGRFSLSSVPDLARERDALYRFFNHQLGTELRDSDSMFITGNEPRYRKHLTTLVLTIAQTLFELISEKARRLNLYTYELRYDSKAAKVFRRPIRELFLLEEITWKELLIFLMNSEEETEALKFLRSIEPLDIDPEMVTEYLETFCLGEPTGAAMDEIDSLYESLPKSGERIKLMELVANPAVDFSRDDDGFG